jgi:hypothetical protein
MTHTAKIKLDRVALTLTVIQSDDPRVRVGKTVTFPQGQVDLLPYIKELLCPPQSRST